MSRTEELRRKREAKEKAKPKSKEAGQPPVKLQALPIDIRIFKKIDQKITLLLIPCVESITIMGSMVYLSFKPEYLSLFLKFAAFEIEHPVITGVSYFTAIAIIAINVFKQSVKRAEIERNVRSTNTSIKGVDTFSTLEDLGKNELAVINSAVPALNKKIFGEHRGVENYILGTNAQADEALLRLAEIQYNGEHDVDEIIAHIVKKLHENEEFSLELVNNVARHYQADELYVRRKYKPQTQAWTPAVGGGNDLTEAEQFVEKLKAEAYVEEIAGEIPTLNSTKSNLQTLQQQSADNRKVLRVSHAVHTLRRSQIKTFRTED